MSELRYIDDAVTLQLDPTRCNGCGLCVAVCPRGVFAIADGRATLVDRGACIECGACALNCAARGHRCRARRRLRAGDHQRVADRSRAKLRLLDATLAVLAAAVLLDSDDSSRLSQSVP